MDKRIYPRHDTIQMRMPFQHFLYFIHNISTLPIIQLHFLFPDPSLQQLQTLFHSQRKYLTSQLGFIFLFKIDIENYCASP